MAKIQNPGWRAAGASRNQLGGWLHSFPTASDRQAQMLTQRFGLSACLARDVAQLLYGSARHD